MKKVRDTILEFEPLAVASGIMTGLPPWETMAGYSPLPIAKHIGGLLKAKGRALVARKLTKKIPGAVLVPKVPKPKVISARKQPTLKKHKPH
jgi:hypothetical protein